MKRSSSKELLIQENLMLRKEVDKLRTIIVNMCASSHKLDTERSSHSSASVVTAIEQPQNMLWLKQEYARLSKPIKK
jgi:hypothetical protein